MTASPPARARLAHDHGAFRLPHGDRQWCAFELIERQALRTPHATAVAHENTRWSYAELDRRATRVAVELAQMGVGRGSLVALCTSRTPRMVAAILGIHKAGAAYVPLDSQYPPNRTAFMLDDTCPQVLLTETSLLSGLPLPSCAMLLLDTLDLDEPVSGWIAPLVSPHDLSHVIYTSGSTGTPKGVAIEHHSLTSLVEWSASAFSEQELGGLLSWTSLCFDVSVFELFAPLAHGGTVILCDHLAYPDPTLGCEVRMLSTVPSLMRELLRRGSIPSSITTVLLAGEPLTTAMADLVHQRPFPTRVLDLYGPSECTTFSTCGERRRGDPATIGRPITGTSVTILDEAGRRAAAGESGELFISGAGVGREYLHRPALTAERFVMMEDASGRVARHYRTGDRVRERADGQLEFIGRLDNQVKVHGVRIELGEIEAAILATGLAQECVAAVQRDAGGSPSIAAYVLRHVRAPTVSAPTLRNLLEQTLVRAMIPASITFVESLPLGATGKIDRSRLPAPSAPEGIRAPAVQDDSLAGRVARLFALALGHSSFTFTDDFFDLGGTSLMALRLSEEVHREFDVRVPLAALVGGTSVMALAALVMDCGPALKHGGPLVAIRTAGARLPFFLVHAAGGNVLIYRALAAQLPPDLPVYALQASGLDGSTQALDRVEHMAALYVQHVRDVQQHGPYRLGGSSVGGSVALEMARLLEESGEQVSLVALLDTFPSRNSFTVERRGPLGRARSALWRLATVFASAEARRSVITQLRRTIFRGLRSPLRSRTHAAGPTTAVALVVRGCRDAHVAYRPSRTRVRPTLLRAMQLRAGTRDFSDPRPLWERALPGHVDVTDVPGNHESMLAEPHVAALAQRLDALLVP
ncbi:MAG: non-ribosomal peptide synthetase [Gemmatimonadetes bacterium]|nr:non-ribosomal peptide synthetase [Gemmatimonadota bacterium]